MLRKILDEYLRRFPDETGDFEMLRQQLAENHAMQNDRTQPGHATASAWVLSPDRTKLLLVHHNFLQMWLQPGGHMDPEDKNPLAAARREAKEETRVQIAQYLPLLPDNPLVPFNLGTHPIPERPERDMPAHYHHDFCYLFVAKSEDLVGEMGEISQLGWFRFDAPECANVAEILAKLRRLGLISG